MPAPSSATGFVWPQPGKFKISLKGTVPAGSVSQVRVSALGKSFNLRLTPTAGPFNTLATIDVPQAGYVRIDVQGISRTGPEFAQLQAIELSGTAAAGLVYANLDADWGYYWSRRGPSVHMSYSTPAHTEYLYNELTIPVGEDAVGSYFMANGFGEGYFGIQVKEEERWVLFSVWDADSGKTTLVKKGPEVVSNEFGGEGTGGQSYLVYPWKAGTTYPFITRVRPDGQGNTLYSSWFYAVEQGQWRFIATWKRPATNTWLTGAHSFCENFIDTNGFAGRKMLMGQQWAVQQERRLDRAEQGLVHGGPDRRQPPAPGLCRGCRCQRPVLPAQRRLLQRHRARQSILHPPAGRQEAHGGPELLARMKARRGRLAPQCAGALG